MSVDEITGATHPDFCSENCNVGFNDVEARHRSAGFLAARGGPIGDRTSRAKKETLLDVVPTVSLEQPPFRAEVSVLLAVNVWITDRHGWTLPAEMQDQGFTCSMTPDRAEHLAEILVSQAKAAREAMSADASGSGRAA